MSVKEEADLATSKLSQSGFPVDTPEIRNAPSNKRAVADGKSLDQVEEKKPKIVASLLRNIAPQRRARIGPQYQANIPPLIPFEERKQVLCRAKSEDKIPTDP